MKRKLLCIFLVGLLLPISTANAEECKVGCAVEYDIATGVTTYRFLTQDEINRYSQVKFNNPAPISEPTPMTMPPLSSTIELAPQVNPSLSDSQIIAKRSNDLLSEVNNNPIINKPVLQEDIKQTTNVISKINTEIESEYLFIDWFNETWWNELLEWLSTYFLSFELLK
jgi:hypothetical protein